MAAAASEAGKYPWPARELSLWSGLFFFALVGVGGYGAYLGQRHRNDECKAENEAYDVTPMAVTMAAMGTSMVIVGGSVLFLSAVASAMTPRNYAGGVFPTGGVVYQALAGLVVICLPVLFVGFLLLHKFIFFDNFDCAELNVDSAWLPHLVWPLLGACWMLVAVAAGSHVLCSARPVDTTFSSLSPAPLD